MDMMVYYIQRSTTNVAYTLIPPRTFNETRDGRLARLPSLICAT